MDYDCNNTSNLREIVGGYMQLVQLLPDIFVVVDDDGKLKGAEPNLMAVGFSNPIDVFVGTLFFVGESRDNEYGESDFCSLTDSQIKFLELYCDKASISGDDVITTAKEIVAEQLRRGWTVTTF